MREGEGGRRWKEESRDGMQDGGSSRWRVGGGGGEEGLEGVRQQQQWKEEPGVIRRGQVVAGGARAKGEGGRRGGVSHLLTLLQIMADPAYVGGCIVGCMVQCKRVQAVAVV